MTLAVIPIVNRAYTTEAASGTKSETTMNISDGKATVNLTTTSTEGTFATSSSTEMAEFGVKTTNYTGYTLTIVADDDDKTLVNSDSTITTHNTFSSISSVIDEKTFDTSTYNGKWGYKPSKMGSVDNVGFWPSPTTKATTLNVTSCANSTTSCPDSEDTYTIALGARAGYAQAAGTYSKTMTLTATANPVNYRVTYTDNTGDTSVVNLPDTTTSSTTGTSATLSTVRPSRTGYVFNKWCDVAPISSGTVCTGNTYDVGDSFPINQTTSNVITLYATWTIPTYDITIKPTTGIVSVSLQNSDHSTTTDCTDKTSGCTVRGLTYGESYTLSATTEDGYTFSAWSPEGAGSIANITDSSTSFTVGDGTTTITAVAAGAAAKSVKVNFSYAGGGTAGVSSVSFKETNTGTTAGTVTSSGGSVILTPGTNYTVTTTSATDYGIKSYALNNASYGTLATTTDNLTYFLPNTGSNNAEITINTCLKTISGTMQTYTTNITYLCDDATGNLTDSRDGQVYTVGVVVDNGTGTGLRTLWMTRNLAIGCNGSGASYGSSKITNAADSRVKLTASNSNVSADWNIAEKAGALTDGNSLDAARMQCNSTYGAWYNYAAASAGTIVGDSNTDYSAYSICPKGWQLPNIRQNTAATSSVASLGLIGGGHYYSGAISDTWDGHWWSASSYGIASRWNMHYANSAYIYGEPNARNFGFYVRCVRS